MATSTRLNPFEFRASIYSGRLPGAKPASVLIPLNSGLVFTHKPQAETTAEKGLNPFEFRASIYSLLLCRIAGVAKS